MGVVMPSPAGPLRRRGSLCAAAVRSHHYDSLSAMASQKSFS